MFCCRHFHCPVVIVVVSVFIVVFVIIIVVIFVVVVVVLIVFVSKAALVSSFTVFCNRNEQTWAIQGGTSVKGF